MTGRLNPCVLASGEPAAAGLRVRSTPLLERDRRTGTIIEVPLVLRELGGEVPGCIRVETDDGRLIGSAAGLWRLE